MLSVPVDIAPPRRHSWVWWVYTLLKYTNIYFISDIFYRLCGYTSTQIKEYL